MRHRQWTRSGDAIWTTMALLLVVTSWQLAATAQTTQSVRREPATSSPTPRLPNGTPNLGRVGGEKGVWAVPYITNMANRVIGPDGLPRVTASGTGRTVGPDGLPRPTPRTRGREREGSAAEPHIPFMPWSAALYDYNATNLSKYDPEGYCLPPGGPRMMATPYPMEIIQLPDQNRILMIFEGATHVWREIYMDGRAHPEGDALNPTFLGHSVGRWDGEILVIETTHLTAGEVNRNGVPKSEAMKLYETFDLQSRNDVTYLIVNLTITDPENFTEPHTSTEVFVLESDWELFPFECHPTEYW